MNHLKLKMTLNWMILSKVCLMNLIYQKFLARAIILFIQINPIKKLRKVDLLVSLVSNHLKPLSIKRNKLKKRVKC